MDEARSKLNASEVRLFDNNFTPGHAAVPGDFNEASFVGYAALPPNFAAAFLNAFGKGETDSAVLTWTFTGGAGTAVVYGWYLIHVADNFVWAHHKFLVPITLTPALPSITRVIQLGDVSEL